MSDSQALVKKGKNCVAVAKSALDNMQSGRGQEASSKLSSLEADGIFLANEAEQLAKRLEAVEKYYCDKDADILRQIGELGLQEENLITLRNNETSNLSAQQSVLRDNESRMSSAESDLRNAERKREKAEEEEKQIQIGATVGGAVLGLLTGGIGLLVGAAAGAGIGATVNACRDEEKDARAARDRRRTDLDNARSAVRSSESTVSSLESQINSLTGQIDNFKRQRDQCHVKAEEVKAGIVLLKKSVEFWFLFKQISQHGVDRTSLLQKIVNKATEKGDYRIRQSRASQRTADTFLDAWDSIESTAADGSSAHMFEIEYNCSRCSGNYTALPHVDGSVFVCGNCHARFALKN